MADLDRTPIAWTPDRHDGLAACRLCSSADAEAGHDWCPVTEGLLCESCCRRVLTGDAPGLTAAVADPDSPDDLENVIVTCISCERGRRWFAQQVGEYLGRGSAPC